MSTTRENPDGILACAFIRTLPSSCRGSLHNPYPVMMSPTLAPPTGTFHSVRDVTGCAIDGSTRNDTTETVLYSRAVVDEVTGRYGACQQTCFSRGAYWARHYNDSRCAACPPTSWTKGIVARGRIRNAPTELSCSRDEPH